MKTVDSKIYDENYYFNICLGAREFKESNGQALQPELKKMLERVPVSSKDIVLDAGCGRGDITLYFAKKVKFAVGIDYSKAAIKIANRMKGKLEQTYKKKLSFKWGNIKAINFPDNYFDVVVCFDVIEHLYKSETEAVLKEFKRVLKPNGILYIHTAPNKTLYNFIYPYYILPMNKLITTVDQIIKKTKYSALPADPRTAVEKEQHVNEPSYAYLKSLLKKYNLYGNLQMEVGFLNTKKSLKSSIYNFFVLLYPVSKFFPLNILFGWAFMGAFINKK